MTILGVIHFLTKEEKKNYKNMENQRKFCKVVLGIDICVLVREDPMKVLGTYDMRNFLGKQIPCCKGFINRQERRCGAFSILFF